MQRREIVLEPRENTVVVRNRRVGQPGVVRANPDRLQNPQMREELGLVEREAQERARIEPLDGKRLRVPRVRQQGAAISTTPSSVRPTHLKARFIDVGTGGKGR